MIEKDTGLAPRFKMRGVRSAGGAHERRRYRTLRDMLLRDSG